MNRPISEIVEENLDDFEAQLREHVELMTTQWETSDWRMWQSDMTQFNGDPDHDYELALNTLCPSNHPLTGETTPEARAHRTASEKCRCLRNIVVQYKKRTRGPIAGIFRRRTRRNRGHKR